MAELFPEPLWGWGVRTPWIESEVQTGNVKAEIGAGDESFQFAQQLWGTSLGYLLLPSLELQQICHELLREFRNSEYPGRRSAQSPIAWMPSTSWFSLGRMEKLESFP